MGQWHESARTWVTTNAEALKALPVAFYTCNLTLAQEPEKTDEVRAYTDPLIEATGVKPVDIGLFAGWNEPKKFSLVERVIMKAMKAPQGDFRDFAAIDSWTRQRGAQARRWRRRILGRVQRVRLPGAASRTGWMKW